MLVFGTQMHIITFAFVCIEVAILFYLLIYKLARPDDDKAILNIWLVLLLLIYNVTGGLLPDPHLPGSVFLQEIIAYATGFITPSYFPYYVYRAFGLRKMRFHAFVGVYLFLVIPFIAFSVVYKITGSLDLANYVLFVPVLYAAWVIFSLVKALNEKYNRKFDTYQAKEEIFGLLLSLTPWVSLPIITIFDLGQALEASVTNSGFLLLLALHLKNHISQSRTEHQRLIESEKWLLNWNTTLQLEVDRRTEQLKVITDQKTNTLINLAHETKTPLTLLKNYIDEYALKRKGSEELRIVRKSIDKLTTDITSLLDIERFERGLHVYDHTQTASFSEILTDSVELFKKYATRKNCIIEVAIEPGLYVKADPMAISRVINNLLENAIKYSPDGKTIKVILKQNEADIQFSVVDEGFGIPVDLQEKVFEPYFQINHKKKSSQGLGLGLPIIKKVVDSLHGKLLVKSDGFRGTNISVFLQLYELMANDKVDKLDGNLEDYSETGLSHIFECAEDKEKEAILIVEDNFEMVHYLHLKLKEKYNVYVAFNGSEALEKLYRRVFVPAIIISDVMMDEMDGYTLAERISQDDEFNNIPFLFLTARSNSDDKLLGLGLGAIDFISKPFSITELQKKIDSIVENAAKQRHSYFHSAVRALSLVNEVGRSEHLQVSEVNFDKNCGQFNLTAREKAVAKLILDGVTYRKIAESLFIAERTVTTHVQNIFEKVQVSNKIELIHKLSA